LGFEALGPEWSSAAGWAFSETITVALFACLGALLALPFLQPAPLFLGASALVRVLLVVSTCQMLRSISFLVTHLPGPSPHCRLGGVGEGKLPAPRELWRWLVLADVKRQATRGCGDLVFSAHITWGTVISLAVHRYGASAQATALCALLVGLQSWGILGARKHYSLDIVVALYVSVLVWMVAETRLVEKLPPHRSTGDKAELFLQCSVEL
jgi:hypothetical protein